MPQRRSDKGGFHAKARRREECVRELRVLVVSSFEICFNSVVRLFHLPEPEQMTISYITLAFLNSKNLMPLSRADDGGVVAFVFSNSDAALAFANEHLTQNDEEWMTQTHTPESIREWIHAGVVESGVTHVAVNPSSVPLGVIPIELFRAEVDIFQ